MGLLHYEPKTSSLSKGWFGFMFNNKEDAEKILNQNWNYGMDKKWTPMFDVESERLDTLPSSSVGATPKTSMGILESRLAMGFWKRLGVFLEAEFSFLKTA